MIGGALIFLCLIALLGFSQHIYAMTGSGTIADPYRVMTPGDLDAVHLDLSANYRLVKDIDLTEYLSNDNPGYNNGKGWLPIGNPEDGGFAGSADGCMIYNCVALGFTIEGKAAPRRIASKSNGKDVLLSNNYANSAMITTPASAPTKGHDKDDGQDLAYADALGTSFWTTEANWLNGVAWDSSVWEISDGVLPLLRDCGASLELDLTLRQSGFICVRVR